MKPISLLMSNLLVGTVLWAIDLNLNLLNWPWVSYLLATFAIYNIADLVFFARDFRNTVNKKVVRK